MTGENRTALLERGRTARAAGDYRAAAEAYRAAREDGDPRVLNLLGCSLARLPGRADDAEAALFDAVQAKPSWPVPWHNLAALYTGALRGRKDSRASAAAMMAYALRLDPTPERVNALAHLTNGLPDPPSSALAALAQYAPTPEILVAYGRRLFRLRRASAAERIFRQALAMDDTNGAAWHGLGAALVHLERRAEAERELRKAIEKAPDHAPVWGSLGTVLMHLGQHAEAREILRHGARLQDEHGDGVGLMMRQYDPYSTRQDLARAHREWGQRILVEVNGTSEPPVLAPRDPRADRKLRVGLVGADFGTHPVGFFLGGFLHLVDPSAMELFVYNGRPKIHHDALTARLRTAPAIAKWLDTELITDETLFGIIRADEIDVLVDLAGHTAGERMGVFARRGAPVQVTWGGYTGTTGLPTMDWLISDPRHSPPEDEPDTTERIWRLTSYVSMALPDFDLPIDPVPPVVRNGYPTFGCFNNLLKLSPECLALWRRLLVEIPDAHLFLKTAQLADVAIRRRVLGALGVGDVVDASRIRLEANSPRKELLAKYNEVDVCLDPWPYSGGVTTIEAMWMGVPTITLGGDRFSARHTYAHQRCVGLRDGHRARDHDDYIRLARILADPDVGRINREYLRQFLRVSPICDYAGFAREWTAALQGMWADCCDHNDRDLGRAP